jgi:NAD(P)-dependent dehydrogenase (short-subunit alcohol dehydrogenase family)
VATAIVTGAGRGIGRAAALALGAGGFDVALVARSEQELVETGALIEQAGGRAIVAPADVTIPASVRAAVELIESAAPDIGVLVNNAGSLRAVGPLWEVEQEDWQADLRSSIDGAFTLCCEVVPRLLARGEGRIVNVVSYAGTRPSPYQVAYGVAKAGLINLTESLDASVRPHGICVFAVAPGFTDTELTRGLMESEAGKRWLPDAGSGQVVEAERSGRLIAALASGEADELHGLVVHALDDVDALLERVGEIRRDELYVPRLRRL